MIAWRLEQYDRLESTSDSCIARACAGEDEGLAILALQQTAGRGSRGRQWQAPAGNLNLSVLLRPAAAMAQPGIYALLAGVALADALSAFLPAQSAPLLKWPNDVLLGAAKLAGILIDARPPDGAAGWLVIGIGVNLAEAPEIPGRLTTTLARHGGQASPPEAATAVLRFLGFWLDRLDQAGVAPILDAWQQRAHPLGAELQLTGAKPPVRGRFAGLSAAGELLLNVGNRIERFSTGEILLGARN